jgi:uncharacterized membrane protein YhhN
MIIYGLNIIFTAKKQRTGSFVTKALITPLLLVIYLAGNRAPETAVVCALLFCFLGDIFLEFSHLFLVGLSAFLAGHVFYIICFINDIPDFTSVPWWLYIFAILYALYGFVFCSKLSIQDTKMRTAASAYCGVILLAGFFSLLRWGSVTDYSFLMVFAGALLFIISDSILAYNRFLKRTRHGGIWVMATYCAAQFLIIMGL